MQNRSISQKENVSELNLLINLFPIIHPYLSSKNQSQNINKILKIKEYWNLICGEPVLTIAWESEFSQNVKGPWEPSFYTDYRQS